MLYSIARSLSERCTLNREMCGAHPCFMKWMYHKWVTYYNESSFIFIDRENSRISPLYIVSSININSVASDNENNSCEKSQCLHALGHNEARLHVVCPGTWTRMYGTKWAFFLKIHMKGTFHGTYSNININNINFFRCLTIS